MDNYIVWRFLDSWRLERQTKDAFRVMHRDGRVDFHTLNSGGSITATYYPGASIPLPEVDTNILVVGDLIGTSSSAVEISPNPRLIAVGWYDLRHLLGPYFIGRRVVGGPEVLIDTKSNMAVDRLIMK